MPDSSLIQELLVSFPKSEQNFILQESGLDLGRFGVIEVERRSLSPKELGALLVPLLRRRDVSNDQFATFLAEAEVDLKGASRPRQVSIKFPRIGETPNESAARLNEVTAGSVLLCDLAIHGAEVFGALEAGETLDSPDVDVGVGSISFTLGGGTLLAAAIGFVVASQSTGMSLQAAEVSFYGGVAAAFVAVVDLAVNWKKTTKETEKLDSEIRKFASETELNKLKAEELRRTLEPASKLVEPLSISSESRNFGFHPAVGTHLLNKMLPSYLALSKVYAPSAVSQSGASSQTSTQASAAGA